MEIFRNAFSSVRGNLRHDKVGNDIDIGESPQDDSAPNSDSLDGHAQKVIEGRDNAFAKSKEHSSLADTNEEK